MRRIFGGGRSKVPPKSLDEVGTTMDARIDTLDARIAKLDTELRKHRDAIKAMGARGGPALEQAKKRAMNVLKQKKVLEGQRDKITANVMRIDETRYTTSALEDQVEMVQALKIAANTMKKQMKKTKELDPDHVEDIMEDLQDAQERLDDLNEAMGAYDVPVDVDDTELMYEMDLLGEEVAKEALADETPAYALDIPDVPTGLGVPMSGVGEDEDAEEALAQNA
jgi:charged multivesicular body protein 5|mmetsp:Transcript_11737/g.33141  ORF Transcript_11737/g.33141 Transcript_11737/m.33141 type:complete len:224 (-) Transcript_11737:1882-2553(-)